MDDVSLAAYAEEMAVIAQAKRRYSANESYHAALLNRYRKWHHWYAPAGGDQWPEDVQQRPGKVHITSNIVKPFIDVDAHLQAKLPRITLKPRVSDEGERARAEAAEKLVLGWLEDSDWEWWMQRLTRVKGIYGKAVLKPFWNNEDKRPDVLLIEQPQNLRIGWGASDFSKKDWALYEYKLSADEIERQFPDVKVTDPKPGYSDEPLNVEPRLAAPDHDDPLSQRQPEIPRRQPTPSEEKQVVVWDYWYKRGDDIYNCIILQKKLHGKPPTHHKEYIDIPYVVVENDHEPGSPEGMSNVEGLIDVQYELNRVLSLQIQLLIDNLDPAWQIDDNSVPDGVVPRGGEIVAAGDGKKITPIDKTINTFPADQAEAALWNQAHRTTGEGEILFGSAASAQDSGRALAVQVESVINRMGPKRVEMYTTGLKSLIAFWCVMAIRINPSYGASKTKIKPILENQTRWTIVAPEITPKDAADHTNNVINKINAMLIDLRTGMDELGVDSPEDVIKAIAGDRSTLPLNPGNVQAMAQVGLLLLQIQQMGLSLEQIGQATQGMAMPGREGANMAQAQARQAQPTKREDQNQPATGQGGAPPPINSTSLVRTNNEGESQTLGQLAFNQPIEPTSG